MFCCRRKALSIYFPDILSFILRVICINGETGRKKGQQSLIFLLIAMLVQINLIFSDDIVYLLAVNTCLPWLNSIKVI